MDEKLSLSRLYFSWRYCAASLVPRMHCILFQLNLLDLLLLLLRDIADVDYWLDWAHFITFDRVVDEDDIVAAALDAELLLEAVDDGEDDNHNDEKNATQYNNVLVICNLQVPLLDHWGDLFWFLSDRDFINEHLLFNFLIVFLSFFDNFL